MKVSIVFIWIVLLFVAPLVLVSVSVWIADSLESGWVNPFIDPFYLALYVLFLIYMFKLQPKIKDKSTKAKTFKRRLIFFVSGVFALVTIAYAWLVLQYWVSPNGIFLWGSFASAIGLMLLETLVDGFPAYNGKKK